MTYTLLPKKKLTLKKFTKNHIYMMTMDDEKKPTKRELKWMKEDAKITYNHLKEQGNFEQR